VKVPSTMWRRGNSLKAASPVGQAAQWYAAAAMAESSIESSVESRIAFAMRKATTTIPRMV